MCIPCCQLRRMRLPQSPCIPKSGFTKEKCGSFFCSTVADPHQPHQPYKPSVPLQNSSLSSLLSQQWPLSDRLTRDHLGSWSSHWTSERHTAGPRTASLIRRWFLRSPPSAGSQVWLLSIRRQVLTSCGRFLDNRLMGNFKIPSILYYDHDGTFRGVKGTIDDDEAEDLHEVRWSDSHGS